jgi:Domain of unknown function (DUF4232)
MRTKLLPVRVRPSLVAALCGLAAAALTMLAPAVSARSGVTSAVRACTGLNAQGTQNMEVWLGDGLGGGVLGGVYYPLEFTNVSRRACSLTGYPGVSAYRGGGAQVGPAGSRNTQRHRTVVLAPGATAHALIKIEDWGALCSRKVAADGLKVFPPGQTTAQIIPFPFGACAHRGVLRVGPVRAGVGVPGYTTS